MCRKHLQCTWLTFLGLIYILGSTDCYLTDEYDDENFLGSDDYYKYHQEDYENPDSDTKPLMVKRDPGFTPYISVGALSNLPQFFESLKDNFKSLEELPQDKKFFLTKQEQPIEPETRIYRPPATAAFLHAIRNQRPSHKMKNFVIKPEPSFLRGTNHYGPALFLAGSGRKRLSIDSTTF